MQEITIPLSWNNYEQAAKFIDETLILHKAPTTVRLRSCTLFEELFSCVMSACREEGAKLHCSFVSRGIFRLQYRSPSGPIVPDLEELSALARQTGANIQTADGMCTIAMRN